MQPPSGWGCRTRPAPSSAPPEYEESAIGHYVVQAEWSNYEKNNTLIWFKLVICSLLLNSWNWHLSFHSLLESSCWTRTHTILIIQHTKLPTWLFLRRNGITLTLTLTLTHSFLVKLPTWQFLHLYGFCFADMALSSPKWHYTHFIFQLWNPDQFPTATRYLFTLCSHRNDIAWYWCGQCQKSRPWSLIKFVDTNLFSWCCLMASMWYTNAGDR